MENIETRLKETSDTCLKTFKAWNDNKKSADNREQLQDAIHELRKVASRLEIELAISERDQNAQKPLPIPPHRDARKKSSDKDNDQNGNDDIGNRSEKKRSGPRKSRKQDSDNNGN